ncbi:MAG: hypothetical protein SNH88_01575 [Rikenellaceae bacterium]
MITQLRIKIYILLLTLSSIGCSKEESRYITASGEGELRIALEQPIALTRLVAADGALYIFGGYAAVDSNRTAIGRGAVVALIEGSAYYAVSLDLGSLDHLPSASDLEPLYGETIEIDSLNCIYEIYISGSNSQGVNVEVLYSGYCQ